MKNHDRSLAGRGASVCEDWQAWLPDLKDRVFQSHSHRLDTAYGMLSVSLNEAIGLRDSGQTAKSFQAVGVTPALCSCLAGPLAGLIRSLGEHAKHYGTIPNAAPLNPGNFKSLKSQRSARMSSLLNIVLLSHRSQFLHKLSTLTELVDDLHREFSNAAAEISEDTASATPALWTVLDDSHFDLNTCLREAIVLLKSFLVAIPENELPGFEQTYQTHLRATSPRGLNRTRLLRHRRIPQIAGE